MANSFKISETYRFLQKLELNNHKAWLDENRADYELCRTGFTHLVQEWIDAMILDDPELAGQAAKTAIFRLNRDVRFSTNKSPYKTNFSAYLAKGGKKYPGAGYYLHIDPKGSFLACGIWMPPSDILQAIRQEIDYNLDEYNNILQTIQHAGDFESRMSERLSRPPKGYEADNPAIEHLKQKSFVMAIALDEKSLTHDKVINRLQEKCKQIKPFADFLNRAVDSLNA